MPHIIVECSENVYKLEGDKSLSRLMTDIAYVLSNMLPAKIHDCKSRLYVPKLYLMGSDPESKYDGFVHISIKLLKGRDIGILNKVADLLLVKTKDHLKIAEANLNFQASVEIEELSDIYKKETK